MSAHSKELLRQFLDSYHPNHTFYLPENARRQLLETGSRTGMADEPASTYARHISPYFKIGRAVRFRKSEVDAALEQMRMG